MYNLQNDIYVASTTLDAGDYQYYFDVFDSTDGYFRTITLSGLHVSKETPTGGVQLHENRPPYYALVSIMKL
jgi:hypothetical protein